MLRKIFDRKNQNQVLAILHQLLMAMYGFGLLLILYRVTTKDETGRWILFISAVSMADMLLHGFLQTPVIRKIAMERSTGEKINIIASNAFLFSLIVWMSASLLIWGSSFVFTGSELLRDLRWYPLLGLSMIFFNVTWWIGMALSDFKAIIIQRVMFCLTSTAILGIALLSQKTLTLTEIVISQLAGYALSSFIGIVFVRSIKISFSRFDLETFKYFITYGRYTAGSMLMGSMLRNADVFMIGGFLGHGAVAIYTAAQKTVEIFEVALRGVASHALPEFCKCANNFQELFDKYRFRTVQLMLIFLPLLALMSFFSEDVIRLLSGSTAYNSAAILLRIFMIYVVLLVVDRMTGVMLEALGLARFNLVKTFMLVAVNIGGNAIALYFFHSLPGVAIASIFAAITGIVVGSYFILKHASIPVSRYNIQKGINHMFKWNLQ
jgi:O-antigen/teichoic acid export membrane protein